MPNSFVYIQYCQIMFNELFRKLYWIDKNNKNYSEDFLLKNKKKIDFYTLLLLAYRGYTSEFSLFNNIVGGTYGIIVLYQPPRSVERD